MLALPPARYRTRLVLASLCLLLLLTPCPEPAFQKPGPKAPPTIVFMTDFGNGDDSVAICKGVMYGIEPNLRIVDLTHQVMPFSILDGARFLYGATPYRSEEHTSELQSRFDLVCRLLLEKKNNI